jgi:succinyl-diaminopimelate desuccinylase
MKHDPIILAQKLIQFPTVTPVDAGIVDYLIELFSLSGFDCKKLVFEDVTNLYARFGTEGPNIFFAGHTDVVPVGGNWSVDPFAAIIKNGMLYGRGAADMKAAIACFITATLEFIESYKFKGSISFLISGNEEEIADNGTPKVLQYLKENNQVIDACIVGEPTCANEFGDIIKYGRRGSISFHLKVIGKQGHVAYPDLADNPITKLIDILSKLNQLKLDDGNEDFDKSNFEIIDISVGNKASNIIPAQAEAKFNIRFNDIHTSDLLKKKVLDICGEHECISYCSAEAFIGAKESTLVDNLKAAVNEVTGAEPKMSTSGGTSDARFIKNYAPVVEFGLLNKTAHHVDEHVALEDILKLKQVYLSFLKRSFL